MIATLTGVMPVTAQTILAADAALNATSITLDELGVLDESGGLLDINGVTLRYEPHDDGSTMVTLADPLPAAALAGDVVTALDVTGSPLISTVAYLDLGDGGEGVEASLSAGMLDRLRGSDGQSGIAVLVEPDSDDGWMVVGLADVESPQDAVGLVLESVASDKLSTSALGPALGGGDFEDLGDDGKLFAGWDVWWWTGNPESSSLVEVRDAPIAGRRSPGIAHTDDASGRMFYTRRIYPVAEGTEVYVEVAVRTDRAVTSATGTVCRLLLMTAPLGHNPLDLPVLMDAEVVWTEVASLAAMDTAVQTISGTVLVPDGHSLAQVAIVSGGPGDGGGAWTLVADSAQWSVSAASVPSAQFATVSAQRVVVPSAGLLLDGMPLAEWLTANGWAQTGTAREVIEFEPYVINNYGNGDRTDATGKFAYVGVSGDGNRAAVAWFDAAAISAALSGKTVQRIDAVVTQSDCQGDTITVGHHTDTTASRTIYANVSGKTEGVATYTGSAVGVTSSIPLPVDPRWGFGQLRGLLFTAPSRATRYQVRLDGLARPDTCVRLRFTV